MKKNVFKFLAALSILFLLTGCANKDESTSSKKLFDNTKIMECNKTETDEDGNLTTDTVKITYNSKKVLKVKSTNIMEIDPEYLDTTFEFGSSFAEIYNDIKGIKMTYEKSGNHSIKAETEIDYLKLDVESLKAKLKEKLGELYDEDENNLYTDKEYSVEEFKTEYFEDYSCK